MKLFGRRVVLATILVVLWIALAQPLSLQEVGVAIVVGIGIALLPLPGADVYGEVQLVPRRIGAAVSYLGVFLVAVVRSNLDVAFRVLNPRLPINPGIVRVKTRLKSRLGRLLLANSITLTPGTISVAIEGEDIYIHWINVGARDVEEATRQIVHDFEKYLEVSLG
ncbi:MAG: Na+/H+ antiporter subunit E [Spirochaeta sp.]|jgi:multicomponent Na+:H+ antiporter subunit E|nr:Na+/H+ antiporter subunit E [Spirochaeta sp.]